MTDPHIPTPERKKIERRLIVADLLKYAAFAVMVGGFFIVTVQNQHTLDAVRNTQTEGSPLLRAIQDQQDDIEKAVSAAVATNDQLADCLTPGGKCYQDAKQRQAAFLQVVGVYVSCAAGLADLPEAQRVEAVNGCVSHWSEGHR